MCQNKEEIQMLLRKQTVWLLTMLSLVAVLSVYYITSPTPEEQANNSVVKDTEKKENVAKNVSDKDAAKGGTVATEQEESVFAAMRLDLNDNRSKLKEQYQSEVADTSVSEEKRVEVYEKMQELAEVSTKEGLLESLIINLGYKDALVRSEDGKVQITVKAEKPSAKAANEIIQMVNDEIGQTQSVAVEFQPAK